MLGVKFPGKHHELVHPMAVNAKPFSPHCAHKHLEIEMANLRRYLVHDFAKTLSEGSLHIKIFGLSIYNIFRCIGGQKEWCRV